MQNIHLSRMHVTFLLFISDFLRAKRPRLEDIGIGEPIDLVQYFNNFSKSVALLLHILLFVLIVFCCIFC